MRGATTAGLERPSSPSGRGIPLRVAGAHPYPCVPRLWQAATLTDVRAFQRALLPESLLEAFLVGNLDEAEVGRMVQDVSAAIPAASALPDERIPRRRVRVLPVGRSLRQYVTANGDELNSATEVYLQVRPCSPAALLPGPPALPVRLAS